jgi:hypothetical protein
MSYLLAPFVFESVPNVMPFVSTYMSASAIVMVNARTASSLGSTVHPRARQAVETLLVAVVIHDELRNAELGLDEGHRTGAAQLVEDRGLRAPCGPFASTARRRICTSCRPHRALRPLRHRTAIHR